jgi:hypothetical protein
MFMNRLTIAGPLFLALLVSGCTASVSANPNDYVGEYVFTPNDNALEELPDFVILRQDETALELKYSKSTGNISTKQDNWYLHHGTDEEVVIGRRAFPIEVSHSAIRLTINEVGQYYEKVR